MSENPENPPSEVAAPAGEGNAEEKGDSAPAQPGQSAPVDVAGTDQNNATISAENDSADQCVLEEEALSLPRSAADGLIKKPFARPLDTVEIPKPPELTPEQQDKYDSLLRTASSWTEVPTKLEKNAPKTPITEDERMFITRECLLRYLRATKWNVGEAGTRLLATLTWRREYGVEEHTADYISIENETGKQMILGYDINGRPCLYMMPSRQNTKRSDRQIQHLVFMLERVVDLMVPGQETLALLINFKETGSGQGASVAQGRQTLYILQNHYPERLGRALVSDVPFFIWGFFKIITPFIDPQTREKLKFNEEMSLHVPSAQLAKSNGGDVEFEYDHSVYWPALIKLAESRRAAFRKRWEDGGKLVGEYEGYLRGGDEKSLAQKRVPVSDMSEKVEATATGAPQNANGTNTTDTPDVSKLQV